MNELLLLLIPTLAELIITIIFVNKFFGHKIKPKRISIFLFTLMLIVLGKKYIKWQIIISVISLIVLFVSIKLYTQLKIKDVMTCYVILTIFTVLLVQVPTIPFIRLFEKNTFFPLIHSGIFVIWGSLLAIILPLNKFYNAIKRMPLYTHLVLADCGIFTLFVMWYSQIQRTYFFENIILFVFFSLVALFINTEIYISYIKISEQKKRIKIYEEYLPILDEMILAVRKRQHNYDNKIQAIQAYPSTCKTYDELVEKLSGPNLKLQFSSLPSYLLKTNLTIIAGYIYKKCIDATKVDKTINVYITDNDLPTILPQYEIIDLLGILIDNGLEAIPRNGKMDLLINSFENKLIITTKNQGPFVSSELNKKMFTPGYSTKNTSDTSTRGLGLSYLKDYVDAHSGEITVTNEEIDGICNIVFNVEV